MSKGGDLIAAPTIIRHRFTVDEYERMIATGILAEGDRVELLGGEITEMSPIGPPHASVVDKLTAQVVRLTGDFAVVRVQNPLRLEPASEPQPDLAVVKAGNYRQRHPTPRDVFLVIEVSDTTRDLDRRIKLPLYAAAGIPEAWLVDLEGEQLERHSQPGSVSYRLIALAGREEALTSTVLPTLTLGIDALLAD